MFSVLNTFLGTTCEWPHEMHKAKNTKTKERKQGAKYAKISLNFFPSFDISSHLLQFTRRTFPVTDVT